MTDLLSRDPAGTAVLVRRSLIGLTVISFLSAAFELASERHWNDVVQLIPWATVAVLAVATAMALLPGRRALTAARILALLVLVASIYGVAEHILANYESGALDQRFADTWETLPMVQRVVYAATKTVGPAPTLAPGVLGQAALLLLIATLVPRPGGGSGGGAHAR